MNISSLLKKVLYGDHEFCALCYKTMSSADERSQIDAEVILLIENNEPMSWKISEILDYILGEDVFTDVSAFQSVCYQCVTTAVNSYKFIKESKGNVQRLKSAVLNLTDCLHTIDVSENWFTFDSLFLTLNQDDLSVSNHYYDNLRPTNTKPQALVKLNAATSQLKIVKQEFKDSQKENVTTTSRSKNEIQKDVLIKSNKISTLDMLHNGDMSVLICKECFKEFPSVSNLRNHFLRLHAPKQYKCSECPKSFGTKPLLRAHQAENHVNMVCSECGKIFKNVQTFKNHEKTHYMKIVCPECGRSYKNQNTYKKHLDNKVCQVAVRHHPSDAKFTCDYCGKKYTQKISLRVHIQYEHLNYKHHECKWCSKKFWCQARLKAHIVKHTKEKKFICTICGGKFVTKESLLYHTRIHTGEKPYPCPYCEHRFLSASRRLAHVKSQHMDPTVECEICHSKFKSIHYLAKHKQIHEISNHTHEEPILEPNTNITTKECHPTNSNVKLELDDVQERIVYGYNLVENEANAIKMKVENIKSIDFVILGKNNEEPQQFIHNEQMYLEVSQSEEGKYNIKVSQNID